MTISLPNRVKSAAENDSPFPPYNAVVWTILLHAHIIVVIITALQSLAWTCWRDDIDNRFIDAVLCCQIPFLASDMSTMSRHSHHWWWDLMPRNPKHGWLSIIFLECIFDASWISAVDACFCFGLICPGVVTFRACWLIISITTRRYV